MRKRKIPRAAEKILPFRGTIIWPLPDGLEPLERLHPPIKARPGRRFPQDAAKVQPAEPKPKPPEFRWLPQG